jgi:hypothetical protein
MMPGDDEALVLDAYLDALLAGRDEASAGGATAALDERLVVAARVVRLSLPRFHPSFRFEDRLARALAAASSAGPAVAAPHGASPTPVVGDPATQPGDVAGAPARRVATPVAAVALDPRRAGPAPVALEVIPRASTTVTTARDAGAAPAGADRRGVIVGGAIASGVSIAGALLLAWRRARGDGRWEPLA